MRKFVSIGLVAVLLFAVVMAGCISSGGETSSATGPTESYSVEIYTGGTSGVYYPLGSAYANILNQYSKDETGIKIEARAVTSGASVSNAQAIGEGRAQAAIMQNDVAYYAFHGTTLEAFQGKAVTKIRGVAALYPETIQFVVKADSDIKTLEDLKGKKVAVGAAGSGTAVAARQILEAAGVWNDVDKVYLKFSEAAQQLKLGQIDAAVIVSGAPTPAIDQIAVQTPVRVLPIGEDILKKLKDKGYIFYVSQTLPKDTYKGMTEDTSTLAVKAILVVSADVPDDVVYAMTRLLFLHVDELRQVHAKAQYISFDTALDGMSIPLHPGAVKYYEEKGKTVSSELKP
ncbi:C4-dicarboxylate ABC transporter substrate-binding protein [Thermococcus celericrescens]|uniref:C4-dicarboxylate ABC transporter substrate-binding protein n=1 Tax=Thermococcus celericrescens TaxID=227598 RepID=A0A124EAZ8_9EURY|nr:TAXI family TRAP transporter solute-binding subunit [Thermococcus celericrescens]KUH31677.1 C4-dicarboxylate ABC transporter substrate-binding protein [Thermococcus celericrescens]